MTMKKFWNEIIPDINTSDGKIMFIAIISLLVVVCLVVALHVYARRLLGRAQRRRISAMNLTRLNHFHAGPQVHDDSNNLTVPKDGLDASSIALLPLFVYHSDSYKNGVECAICLSAFDEEDICRYLPSCKHAFHVECVDRWLGFNSTCPVCRANVALDKAGEASLVSVNDIAVGYSTQTISNDSGEEVLGTESKRSSFSQSPSASPLLPTPCIGNSLMRMLSMNRFENKVFPTSSDNEPTV